VFIAFFKYHIEVHGVVKLLTNLSINKASCPDNIVNKVLKACAEELAPVMSHIFQLSLTTGEPLMLGYFGSLTSGSGSCAFSFVKTDLNLICCLGEVFHFSLF
jgi:hypothetical protein